jgi:hypothetical protein
MRFLLLVALLFAPALRAQEERVKVTEGDYAAYRKLRLVETKTPDELDRALDQVRSLIEPELAGSEFVFGPGNGVQQFKKDPDTGKPLTFAGTYQLEGSKLHVEWTNTSLKQDIEAGMRGPLLILKTEFSDLACRKK